MLARALMDACGGVDECIDACRAGRTQLYAYRDASSGRFMPADVMADLEAYCGQPIYSRALVEARPASATVDSVVEEACDIGEAAVSLQRLVRMAAKDGELTEHEKREIEEGLQKLEAEARDLRAAMDTRGAS